MISTPVSFGAAIVAVGNFNPRIYTVDWLERHGFIGVDDADFARQNPNFMTSPQLSRFEAEWFMLQVLEQQMAVESRGVLTPNVKDLATNILTLLSHSPITGIGINFFAHFRIFDLENYHKIGDALAPKDIWQQLFPSERTSFGMDSLQIGVDPFKRGEQPPEIRDFKKIVVQPSKQVQQGVNFYINNHFDVQNRENGGQSRSELAAQLIEAEWQTRWDEAQHVFEAIINSIVSAE